MAFTALHRALGLPPSDLTYDLIEQAIAQGVEEADDLDWKAVLPSKEKGDEWAKDLAAMANSGGGIIVFGVGESGGGSSAAKAVVPVTSWGDGEERRLRSIAYSAVQPPVYGLTFTALKSPIGDIVVVATVSASPDAPHLVWVKDQFTAPRRYGAQTVFMSERDIERAYRARFEEAADRDSKIVGLATKAVAGLGLQNVWFTVTCVPLEPRPVYAGRVTQDEAQRVLLAAVNNNPFANPKTDLQIPHAYNPRTRFRMWRADDGQQRAGIEIHDDGSLVYAFRPKAIESEGPAHLHPMHVERGFVQAFWLLRNTAAELKVASRYRVRVDVHYRGSEDVYVRLYDRAFGTNGLVDLNQLTPMNDFIPVETIVDPLASEDAMLRDLWALVTDVLNQGGIPSPHTTYLKQPSSET